MTTLAIQVRDLHRSFGTVHAVNGVTFDIPVGSVCGFIGANGAGKTTTMRIMATLDMPSSGSVKVHGFDVVEAPNKVRHILGWMPDHFNPYPDMTVLEFMDFQARAFGYRGKERVSRVQQVMEFTDLASIADRPANKLSKGMTQRLCLGRTLIHDPSVLILDEPAAGLDPKARVELKHLIRILASEGKTILISSHILSELGEMCDAILFIDGGKIVHHGDAETLKQGTDTRGGVYYDVHLAGDPNALASWCQMQPNIEWIAARRLGGRIRLAIDTPDNAAQVLARMVKDALPIIEFRREQRNLEDAFMAMVGERPDAEPATATDNQTPERAIEPPPLP